MSGPVLIGVDVGTTKTKAAAFDLDGRRLGRHERPGALARPRASWAEQDAEHYVGDVEAVVRALADEVGASRIAGVGICSQVNTHVFADADGRALAPAISWQDQRCAGVAAELAASSGSPVDASSLLARAEWLRREAPETWERTRWILSPKDYVNLRLTGAAASDPLSSIGVVDDAGAYLPLDGLVPGVEQRLPPLHDLAAAVGTSADGAFGLPGGVPVAVATMDAWGNLYGSGATTDGDAFEVAGTSEILGLLALGGAGAPGVIGFPPYDGMQLFAGPTQAGGDALRWYAELCGCGPAETLARAESAPPGSRGVTFMPHLAGERAPLWDPHLRGAFLGLDARHGAAELSRAVLEGVAYSARHLLETLEAAGGRTVARIAISGGAAVSDLWCQIKADVLGRPLDRVAIRDSGVLGAALMGGAAAGALSDLRRGARELVRVERTFEPRDRLAARYAESYDFYREAQAALAPLYRGAEAARGDKPRDEPGER